MSWAQDSLCRDLRLHDNRGGLVNWDTSIVMLGSRLEIFWPGGQTK